MHLKKLVTATIIGSFMLATVPTNLVLADNETSVVETTKEEIVPISQEENKNEETANKEETKPDNQTLENTEEKSENEKEVQSEDKKVENKKENKVEEKKKNNNQNNNKKKDTVNSKKNGKNTKYAFTLDSVNMRSQANTKSKVLVTLKKNTKLTILKKENGWLKVQYGKKVGYVSAKYVKVTSTSKPIENQKPVNNNNNSNSANKKPNSNTVKGMSFGEFQKQLTKLGFRESVIDENGGSYRYYEGQRPAGLCDIWTSTNDIVKEKRVSFGFDFNSNTDPYCKTWRSTVKNCFNLLLPTKGDELYKIVTSKKPSDMKDQTLYMDGRRVEIEISDFKAFYVSIFEK